MGHSTHYEVNWKEFLVKGFCPNLKVLLHLCLSYLTKRHKKFVERVRRSKMDNHLFVLKSLSGKGVRYFECHIRSLMKSKIVMTMRL